MKITKVSKLKTQWFGTVDNGKCLEIIAADEAGIDIKNVPYPLATVLADEKGETLLLEIYTDNGIVQLPLSELKRAFELAPGEVHSEAWYENNVYNDEST